MVQIKNYSVKHLNRCKSLYVVDYDKYYDEDKGRVPKFTKVQKAGSCTYF